MVIKMMERLKIGIGLCLALLIILPASATAKIGPMPEMPGHSQGCENGVDWSKPDANNIWRERAIGSRYFGWINYTNGHATGRFVDFYFNESTGTISQYRVKVYSRNGIETLDVFESIVVNIEASEVRVMGSIFMAKGTQGMIIVHDNPAAVIHHIIWNSTNVVYNIGADFYATTTYRNYTFPNVAWLLSNTTNLTGSVIAGNGTMNVESKKIEVSLSSAQASFRLHSLHRYGHPLLALHYASGKVGAEISLSLRNDMVLDDIAAYREDIRAQVLEMNEARLRLRIEGEGSGTVIALTLENQVKDANKLHPLPDSPM